MKIQNQIKKKKKKGMSHDSHERLPGIESR
jgi:hypothetical protein